MNHNHNTNRSSCKSPRCLPYNLTLSSFILEFDVEHLSKVLSKVMRGSSLNRTSRSSNVRFDSCSLVSSSKLLFFCLVSRNDRYSVKFLIYSTVKLQCLSYHDLTIFISCMSSVTLLPQKLSTSQKWSRILEFPSHNITPLIKFQWQISVGLNPIREGWIHDGLTGGTDSNGLGKLTISRPGHPCNFRCKSLHVVLLLLETFLGYKERKVRILHSQLSNLNIEPILDQIPNCVRPWTKNVAS
mmetsp:Transcript_7028/g.10377  ORF Transcript_7028/g.10377 Transcript_7028/m.10377 type:complete len:242 (+) Transcript_7028:782-1507(+)